MDKTDKALLFSHGVIVGSILTLLLGVTIANVWTSSNTNEERDYLRRYIARTGRYTPCSNEGFDWAMGVDCAALREAQNPQGEGE